MPVPRVAGVSGMCRRHRRRDVFSRIGHELLAAARVAEMVRLPAVLRAATLGGAGLYGHPANGILCAGRWLSHGWRSAGDGSAAGRAAWNVGSFGMCMLVLGCHEAVSIR